MANSNYGTVKKVRVTDPVLMRLLLEHLMEKSLKSKVKKVDSPLDFLVQDMRSRPYGEVLSLSRKDLLEVHITVKQDALSASLRAASVQRESEEMLDYFIKNGASRAMICSYFKVAKDVVTELRNAVQIEGPRVGRPMMPASKVRDEIQATWYHLQNSMQDRPIRDRVYELHQKFPQWHINALEAALREFPDIEKTLALQSFRARD